MPRTERGIISKNKRRKTTKRSPIVPEKPIASDWINTLNDDCLVRIFKYLPLHERLAIETVCKRWKEVAKLAWNGIRALNVSYSYFPEKDPLFRSITGYKGTQRAGNILFRCGRYLKELKLGDPYGVILLSIIGQHCENLTKLEISFYTYEWSGVKCLPPMPKLMCLKLKTLPYSIPNDFFQALPHETLTELHLCGSDMISQLPDGFLTVFKNLQKLKALTLDNFSLNTRIIEVIAQKSTLTFLSTTAQRINVDMPDFSLLTNLEHLSIQGLNITDDFLVQIIGNNQNLKYVNLTENARISNKGLTDLQKLFQLEELIVNDIPGITDQSLSKMHNLRKLECEGCPGVNNEGIIKLMKYASNLEYLNLAGSNVSVEVLIAAVEITKLRTNDLKLEVVVTPDVKDLWEHDDDYSPLLDVSTKRLDDEDEDEEEEEIDDPYYHHRNRSNYYCCAACEGYADEEESSGEESSAAE